MTPNGSMTLHTMLLTTSALVASAMLAATAAQAGGPTGGNVVVGSATITTPSSTQTVVNQSSKAALINWNSFSIPTGSSVLFEQPTSTSLTVNRVLGPNASAIDGQLLANGNIWLINANGILFGRGSQVNVGALLATTSDITDDNFRKGRYRFTKPGSASASVVNQGTIVAAPGGSVVLSASQVSNQGVIQANLGTVVLGGARAFTVDMDGDNLLRYQITAPVTNGSKGSAGASQSALVSNSGTIEAAGGRVLLTERAARNVQDNVINNTGQIEATSVSSHNGEIDFDAGPDGTVNAGGTIDASGRATGETGGAINITGGTVNVANGTKIDASGDAGGGTIQIGGGLHGKGSIANATTTNVGNATISADAITSGNGGTIAIWSDGTTNFSGTVSAKGGATGGHGGFVETSGGHLNVGATSRVVTSAAKGATGTWLLDPTDIDIVSGGTDGLGGSNIDPTTIIDALGGTNVELEATHDITISNAVDYSSTNTLSLLASQDIIANAGIQNSGIGAINLVAGWDGKTTDVSMLTNSGVYGNNGGTITVGGANSGGDVAIGSAGGTTTFAAANLTIEADNGYSQAGYHGAGGGDIVVDLTSTLSINGYDGTSGYAQLGNGSLNGDVSGNITGNISVNATGATYMNVADGGGNPWIGNFASEGSIESGNVSIITADLDSHSVDFGQDVVADLGSTNAPGSGGNFLLGETSTDINVQVNNGYASNTPHDFTLLSAGGIEFGGSIQNAGTGSITAIAGWDGVTTDAAQLTNPGVFGNNGGSIVIGGQNATSDVAIGSAGGTLTLAASNLTIEADNGYAQAGYHGAGGGDIDVALSGNLTLTSDNSFSEYAQLGNGSLNGDVGGNITGNISVNVAGTTFVNSGEESSNPLIGNSATEGSIESGNVTLITGDVQTSGVSGIGYMIASDIGTTASAGSGGNVTIGFTNPQTDFVNTYLGPSAFEYDSPNSLTVLSTLNITLPYSVQNDGAGALTILAGWDPSVAPANVLTTPGAYGNNGAFIWIVGDTGNLHDYNPNAEGSTYVDSGLGVAIGSKGGTTTIGAAQIYIEGLSGYAQIGYHNTGGTGAIDVVANGLPGTGNLTGVSACFDGNANICVIGGRSGSTDANNDPTYAQIGDLGFGVAGTASADINVSATGNIAVAGGGIYQNTGDGASDPGVVDAYGMIGNGDGAQTAAQTVSGNISVNVVGSINFASSTGAGSDAWLGNRTDSDGLSSGDLTLIAGSESDTGNETLGNMVGYALGRTSVAGSGGDVTIGMTKSDIDLKHSSGFLYSSPHNLTLLSTGQVNVADSLLNGGSGDITLIAGWDGTTNPANVLNETGAYGLNGEQVLIGGSQADGNVAVGSMTGTTTVAGGSVILDAQNGYAQIGMPGSGGSGTINVFATSSQAPTYNQDSTPCLTSSGNVCLASGQTAGDYAQIGNGGFGMTGTSSGNINVVATGNVVLVGGGATVTENNTIVAGSTADAYAMIGNGDASQVNATTVGGDINITVGGETYLDSSSDSTSSAWLGNRTGAGGSESGNFTLITGTSNEDGPIGLGDMIVSDLGSGDGSGGDVTVGFTDSAHTTKIDRGQQYSSSNSLTILSASDILLEGTIQNSGTGDITVVAGWDGHTLGTAAQLEAADAYGLNDATLTIGGSGAAGNSALGSAGGTTTVLTDALDIESDHGIAQLGYAGAGTGNIDVTATGNVTVDAATNDYYAQIGNGGSTVSGNVGGGITIVSGGNVLVEEDGTDSMAAIGNISTGSQSGDISVTTTGGSLTINAIGGYGGEGNRPLAFIGNGSLVATSGGATGNITIGAGAVDLTASGLFSQAFIGDGVLFNSSGTTGGNIGITATSLSLEANEGGGDTSQARITNRGDGNVTGNIDIVTTGDIDLDATDANLSAIGNGEASTGTTSGSITVQSGGNISLTSENSGETRIAGGAAPDTAIDVTAADNITMSVTGTPSENFGSGSVLIGNLGDGTTGGNVTVTATNGNIQMDATEDGSAVQIGNVENGVSGSVTGDVFVSAGGSELGTIILDAGGVNSYVLIGDGGLGIDGSGSANGNITIDATNGFQMFAAGNSSVAMVGNGGFGFQGTSGGTISVTGSGALDEMELDASGNNSDVQIGNGGQASTGNATGQVSVTATAGNFDIADSGEDSFVQIGNGGAGHSGGTSGDVSVTASDGSIIGSVTGSGDVQIGNGGVVSYGSNTGNITVTATGDLDLTTASGYPDGSAILIGNGGNSSNRLTTSGFTDSGNIMVSANNITLETKNTNSDIQIGNGGSCAGTGVSTYCNATSSYISTSGPVAFTGTITVDATTSLSMLADSTLNGVWIGNGGDHSGEGLNIVSGAFTESGAINVNVGTSEIPGTLLMETGAPGTSDVRIGNGGYLAGSQATADGGLTIGGDITVDVLGGTTDGASAELNAQGTTASLVNIGNTGYGLTNGTVNGTIDVSDDGSLSLFGVVGISGSQIGNRGYAAGDATGDVVIDAQTFAGDIGYSISNDLPGGDFTLDLSGDQAFALNYGVDVTSNHNLSITNGGDIVFAASVQNAGSGNITIDSSGGTVTIGGTTASGNVAVGSAGGLTSVSTDNLTLAGTNGNAQLGFNGVSGGDISVDATGNVQLAGGEGGTAQIGNGSTLGSSSAGGNVSLTADSMSLSGNEGIAGNSADIMLTGAGNAIGSDETLQVAVNYLAIATNNGGATVNSSQGVSLGVGEDGINLGTGDFHLSAAGPITQTLAIDAGSVFASTSSGAIILTDSSNAFGGATLDTAGSDDASLTDSSALTIAGANVGGTLTLTSGGTIGQSGAIAANALDVTTTNGAITLTNGENAFNTLTVSTAGSDNASFADMSNLTVASANVGGTLSLSGQGTIGQTGAITANALDVTTSDGGAITLTNTGNAFNTASVSTPGSYDASLYDASDLTITSATVGGTLTLSGGGTIGQSGAISANALDVTTTNGAITLTNSENAFNSASVTTSGSDDASLYDASALSISGANVGGTLTLAGGSTIGQSGAITASALDATTTNGAITLTNESNQIATATLNTSGSYNASLNDESSLTVAGATVGGTLQLTDSGSIAQTGAITANTLNVSSGEGDITLTNAGNAIATTNISSAGSDAVTIYDSTSLIVAGAVVGGDVTLLSKGNLTFNASVDPANGSVLAVAGWDGTTTSASALTTGTAFGNNGGSILIGGTGAYGDVSIGSGSGTTTLAGDNVTLEADNGFAQIGEASSSGAISVFAKGNVMLTGGAKADQFAQIGNGGFNVSGNESGDITVNATGNVVLDGGAGQEAYAQIGNGGAESNSSAEEGYSDTGNITVDGAVVTLAAGSGTGSYSQIGQGGYLSGHNLTGTATLGGNITVDALNSVTLTGNGAESYAQIGNGGDLVNSNAANGASGTISGDITVAVANTPPPGSPDPITLTAGSGADSFAQIGNGGRGENTPASGATVDFTIDGNVSISDLTLTGSNTGTDAYAQVGNGDASKTGTGNVSGDISIGPGIDVTINNGTAPGTDSMIGNDTGFGTVTGTISGYTPPSVIDSGTQGAVATTEQTPTTPTDTTTTGSGASTPPDTSSDQPPGNQGPTTPPPTPLDQLADNGPNGSSTEGEDPTDDLTNSLSQSLDPGAKKVTVFTKKAIIPGVLTQIVAESTNAPHGVPPADVDYSSWGNEALWRW